jgi:hypothetical protein
MKMNATRRYLLLASCTAALVVALVVAVNWVIDPYWVHDTPRIAGVDEYRTQFRDHVRLGKAWRMVEVRPRQLILGSSRADVGFDPEHPGFAPGPTFNASLPGASVYELLRYLEYAQELLPLHRVVLAADFFMFNRTYVPRPGFSEARLSFTAARSWDWLATLLSADAFADSLATLSRQTEYARLKMTYLANGQHDWTHARVRTLELGGPASVFEQVVRNTREMWLPPPERRYELYAKAGGAGGVPLGLDAYERILTLAHEQSIELHVVIAPQHAALLEAIEHAGLWDEFETWKRELAAVNAAVAERRSAMPFPVWDFAVLHPVTAEPVPAGADADMRWFWDPSHFKSTLGDVVLDRVLDTGSVPAGFEGFGTRLDR